MEYRGRYQAFDPRRINTYPVRERHNKVGLSDLVRPGVAAECYGEVDQAVGRQIEEVAEAVVSLRREHKPVVLFAGAHLIKNGLGPLVVDLVERGIFTLVAGNGATAIHDFELALFGQTSENVPNGLEDGTFGMADEFGYINAALAHGDQQQLGAGEALGRTICDESFRQQVWAGVGRADSPSEFAHAEVSVLAACYRQGIPFTMHVGIGTDVIDQHESFDGRAKGGCSGRDFLIYVEQMTRFGGGGAVLNIGSAVTGPEVLLKAVSMAANVGSPPRGLVTADFDLRGHDPEKMTDESAPGYYFRDQKSVLTRVPEACGGRGYYIQGNQKDTVPLWYSEICRLA